MPSGKYKRSKAERDRLQKFNLERKGKTYEEYYGREKAEEIKSNKKHKGNWKEGKKKVKGYVHLLKPEHPFSNKNGYIAEHRLVMEEKIQRYLMHKEIVHHINGLRNDNRIENLELTNLSEHFFKHGKRLYNLTREDIQQGIELRIRKPNELGEFYCHKCKNWKPQIEFNKKSKNIYGVYSYCKICSKIKKNYIPEVKNNNSQNKSDS